MIISKSLIITGFNHAGLIKYYSSYEEDKTKQGYLYDVINDDKYEILDDLSNELNIAEEEVEENLDEPEEIEETNKNRRCLKCLFRR